MTLVELRQIAKKLYLLEMYGGPPMETNRWLKFLWIDYFNDRRN